MTEGRVVACPRCGAPVVWGPQSPFRPFCSERCKKIDLGAWANDEYRVPGAEPADDFSSPEQDPTPRG